ncbi:MAG: hypothetical protein U0105_02865 [Candidatus Obscuribacterales bacterium]
MITNRPISGRTAARRIAASKNLRRRLFVTYSYLLGVLELGLGLGSYCYFVSSGSTLLEALMGAALTMIDGFLIFNATLVLCSLADLTRQRIFR